MHPWCRDCRPGRARRCGPRGRRSTSGARPARGRARVRRRRRCRLLRARTARPGRRGGCRPRPGRSRPAPRRRRPREPPTGRRRRAWSDHSPASAYPRSWARASAASSAPGSSRRPSTRPPWPRTMRSPPIATRRASRGLAGLEDHLRPRAHREPHSPCRAAVEAQHPVRLEEVEVRRHRRPRTAPRVSTPSVASAGSQRSSISRVRSGGGVADDRLDQDDQPRPVPKQRLELDPADELRRRPPARRAGPSIR